MATLNTNANLQVSYDELVGTAQVLRTELGNYQNIQAQIESIVNNISTWKGDAHTEFVNKVMGFKNDHVKLQELLAKYDQYLTKAANDYQVSEMTNLSTASKVNEGN